MVVWVHQLPVKVLEMSENNQYKWRSGGACVAKERDERRGCQVGCKENRGDNTYRSSNEDVTKKNRKKLRGKNRDLSGVVSTTTKNGGYSCTIESRGIVSQVWHIDKEI